MLTINRNNQKRTTLLLSLLLFHAAIFAQNNSDSLLTKEEMTDSAKISGYNKYGDLLNDDPTYNPRYSWWLPAVRVVSADVFNWAVAKYVYKYDWPSSGIKDWKRNLNGSWEWDADQFGTNFIGHPHTGNYYFNIARSNGYSFWGSLPFALEGSLLWEYLGENTKPSINDIINTPISGLFLGEIFYRLSSNILDDRKRGRQRVFREILAGIVNPPRAMNRLTQGKMFRVTPKEVYQKEPLNISVSVGVNKVNDKTGKDNLFGTGSTNSVFNIQFDYGDPFEVRHRKPFDFFRFRVQLGYGDDRHLMDNIEGYGLLTGRNGRNKRSLVGIFQHFDYWRNGIFEVGSLGFGGGLVSETQLGRHSELFSSAHLAIVPMAGNNTQFGPDTSEFRHYNFGGGLQAKWEENINLNNWATIGFTGFYYWIHTYNGLPGNSLVGILKPAITVKLLKSLRIGFEHMIYRNDRFLPASSTLHITRTEQKLFLQLYFEDRRFK